MQVSIIKKFHPDFYHKSGVQEAWATRKAIEINLAYKLLDTSDLSDEFLVNDDVLKEGQAGLNQVFTKKPSDSSFQEQARYFNEEDSEGESITGWLFDRLAKESKNKLIEFTLNGIFGLGYVVLSPTLIIIAISYGLLNGFFKDIVKIKKKRIVDVIIRIILLFELSAIVLFLIRESKEARYITIFGYMIFYSFVFAIILIVVDLCGYILASLWKRSKAGKLDLIKKEITQEAQLSNVRKEGKD